jgi:hypothetical protein
MLRSKLEQSMRAARAYVWHDAGAEGRKEIIERPVTFLAMPVSNLGEVDDDFFRADGRTATQTAWTSTRVLPLVTTPMMPVSSGLGYESGRADCPCRRLCMSTAERLHIPLVTTAPHGVDTVEPQGHFRVL